MRYRKLDEDGDYKFGNSLSDFYQNTPEAVAQAVKTRLGLWTGEWFVDMADGTGWSTSILGKYTSHMYEMLLRQRVLETPGVIEINSYESSFDAHIRKLSIKLMITTIYGTINLSGEY